MLISSEIRDDLDKVNIKYSPKSEILEIDDQLNHKTHLLGTITSESQYYPNSSGIFLSKYNLIFN